MVSKYLKVFLASALMLLACCGYGQGPSLGVIGSVFHTVLLSTDPAAGALNTATVNSALAAWGSVEIKNAPGSRNTKYYFDGAGGGNYIIVGQTSALGATSLKCDRGVTLINAAGSNEPVIVSGAYTRPFNAFSHTAGTTTWNNYTLVNGNVTSSATVNFNVVPTGAVGTIGDTAYFTYNATVQSVTNTTTVVLNTSVTTTTGQSVNLQQAWGAMTYGATTITTGAASATQTVGNTAGMQAGTILRIVIATQTLSAINSTTQWTLAGSVTVPTSTIIDLVHLNGSPISWSNTQPLLASVDCANSNGLTIATGDYLNLTGWIDTSGLTTGCSQFFGVFPVLDATSQSAVMIRLRIIPNAGPAIPTFVFTVTSANATGGATYTNSAHTFTVLATIASGTTLICSGIPPPTGSGTLTKASGTGDATITYSANTLNTYTFRKADQNTTLDGITWSYNETGGNMGGFSQAIACLMIGVNNLKVIDCKGTDARAFLMQISEVANVTVNDFEAIAPQPKDAIQVMAPCWDVTVNNLYGYCGDDCLSFDTEYGLMYMPYASPGQGGDCINCKGTNINMLNGAGVALYPYHGAMTMDNCGYAGVTSQGGSSEGTAQPQQNPFAVVHMFATNTTDGTGVPTCGTIFFNDIEERQSWWVGQPIIEVIQASTCYGLNVKQLLINRPRSPLNPTSQPSTGYIWLNGSSNTFTNVTISDGNFVMPLKSQFGLLTGLGSAGVFVSGTPGIERLTIQRCQQSGNGYLINNSTSANQILHCDVDKNVLFNITAACFGMVGTRVNLTNNWFTQCLEAISGNNTCTFYAKNNSCLNGFQNGFISAAGTHTITMLPGSESPTNIGSGSVTFWTVGSGSPSLAFTGDCSGCFLDIGATGVTCTAGATVNNTSTSRGTITTAGLVGGDGSHWYYMLNLSLFF